MSQLGVLLAAAADQEGTGPHAALALGVAACLVASAFLSFSETCLTSLSDSRIHSLLATGGRRAQVLQLWLRDPHSLLTTILIGNNLANILATALMTRLSFVLLGEAAVSAVVGIMTLLVLVFGEVTPKNLARQHAHRVVIPVLHVLRVLHVLSWPATWLLTWQARLTARLFGGDLKAARDVSEAEIETMIDLGAREGVLSAAKAEYLRGVFELSQRSVREIMVARTDLEAIDIDLPPPDILRRLDEAGHSRLPVYRGSVDDIVGILHARDVFERLLRGETPLGPTDVERLLREPLFVPESMRLDALLRLFRKQRQHLVVVLDEFGGTAGIATLEDVLEELVGEIWDEHDEADAVLVRRGPDHWTASGRLPVSALENLGMNLPENHEYDTLGGLLMDLAGEVPSVGRAFEQGGFRLEVLSGDAKRVGLVRLARLPSGGAPAGKGQDAG